jgi:hypothetical protein
MHAPPSELPAGFVRFAAGDAEVVCARHVADAVREAMTAGTLYEYGERHPSARSLAGRGVVYAVPLPRDVERVVIRRNRHGGLLAPLIRDLFLPPTRAARELRTSVLLRRRGVPTPEMLAYVTYAVAGGFKRVDVMTREVPNSFDLSTALVSDNAATRRRALVATARLVRALSAVGARHHDLNVKNILLRDGPNGSLDALVLDVDRVTFATGDNVLEANLARLLRSARKWQALHDARVTDDELGTLAASAREPRPLPLTTLS